MDIQGTTVSQSTEVAAPQAPAPGKSVKHPDEGALRAKLRKASCSRTWERVIITIIIVNAISLGLETSKTVMATIGPLLLAFDKIVLAIFVVELTVRIYVHRWRFFTGAWNLFDFVIVGIALVPASGPFQVLRALRILRVLRLISVVPSLRRVISGFITALPGMASIMGLLSIVFYVASVMATKLFGATFEEWFGTMGASAYSLFQIMTLESWSMGIVRPVMEVMPNAWLFFVPFILMTTFVVLNLFIGVVVSALQEEVEAANEEELENTKRELEQEMTDALKELRGEIAALRAEIREQRR